MVICPLTYFLCHKVSALVQLTCVIHRVHKYDALQNIQIDSVPSDYILPELEN